MPISPYLVLEDCHHSKKKTYTISKLSSLPLFPIPVGPIIFCFYRFAYLDISYKWNHKISRLFVKLLSHNDFKVCQALPSPLSFKLLLVVLCRNMLFKPFKFRAKHSEVSNPSSDLSYSVVRYFKVTFVAYFYLSNGFLQPS